MGKEWILQHADIISTALGKTGIDMVRRAQAAVAHNLCPFCGKEVNMNEFKDELSEKEFKISGLCQKCQDETFSE